MSRVCLLLLISIAILRPQPLAAAPPRLPRAMPGEVGMRSADLDQIDELVVAGQEKKLFPGCVVLVARQGKIVFLQAYGQRRVGPMAEPMTTDSIFDMASVTKPVVTATSVMRLVEQGELCLDTPVTDYWPEFVGKGGIPITLRHLLTHQSGLSPRFRKYPADLEFVAAPRERFLYSCAGCITAGEIVHKVSAKPLDEFAKEALFQPLGMDSTSFGPVTGEHLARTVPTATSKDGEHVGIVNDFQARELDGIAGNAGMFSTAEDLAIFGQMMLNGGEYGGVRILSAETVSQMTTPHTLATGEIRGIGWDMSDRLPNRPRAFSDTAYGHGGWTGTSLWIDPEHQLTVIFLASRHHPIPQGDANRLAVYQIAGQIGDLAIKSLQPAPSP